MSISYIQGPAFVVLGSSTFYSEGAIKLKTTRSVGDKKTAWHGDVGKRFVETKAEISFTPTGLTSVIAILNAFANLTFGQRLLGSSDTSCVIKSADGKTYTIARAGVVSLPDLNFGANKDLAGDVKIVGYKDSTKAWGANGSNVVTVGTWTPSAATFDPTDIQASIATWSLGAITNLQSQDTEDGIQVKFGMTAKPVSTDSHGEFDQTFGGMKVTASLKPCSSPESDLMALFASVARGSTIAPLDLVIDTPTMVDGSSHAYRWTFPNMIPLSLESDFDTQSGRNGTLELEGVRKFTAGVAQPFFTIAAVTS